MTRLLLAISLICTILGFFVKKKYQKTVLSVIMCAVLAIWLYLHGLEDFTYFSIVKLLFCIAASYFLYVVSLFIVGTKFTKENLFPKGCLKLPKRQRTWFIAESSRNLINSTYEELIYRWFLQNAVYVLTENAVLSISITVIVFFGVHLKHKIAIVQMIDIFVFSVFISTLYYWFVNPLHCIVIHIARNQLIINQKYLSSQRENEKFAKYIKIMKGWKEK
ncbi:MAG: CPBP family intramembrane metalloprotease [Ruminococcaceae bacterium]|nr:CPBP family intramembrane metalloprotease [Oscillospiraceae bacterium]